MVCFCRPAQLLTGLCDALGACLEPQPLPDRTMLCLLLSAVTAGHSAQDMTQSCGDRSQVMLMPELTGPVFQEVSSKSPLLMALLFWRACKQLWYSKASSQSIIFCAGPCRPLT